MKGVKLIIQMLKMEKQIVTRITNLQLLFIAFPLVYAVLQHHETSIMLSASGAGKQGALPAKEANVLSSGPNYPSMKLRLLSLLIILSGQCLSQQIQVTPYIQPGNAPTLSREEKVIIWQTDSLPASFTVEYGTNKRYNQSATVKSTSLDLQYAHPYYL